MQNNFSKQFYSIIFNQGIIVTLLLKIQSFFGLRLLGITAKRDILAIIFDVRQSTFATICMLSNLNPFFPCTNVTDVDECQTGSFSCHAQAECVNTDGSYDCSCLSGYNGNGL